MNSAWITGTWFPLFANLCLQSTFILALACITLLACRRRSAALLHWIAAGTLGLVLILPILSFLPPIPIDGAVHFLKLSLRSIARPPMSAPVAVTDPMPQPTHSVNDAQPSVRADDSIHPEASPVPSRPPSVHPEATAIMDSAPLSFWIPPTFTLWLTVAVLLAVRFALGYVRLLHLAQRCQPLADGLLRARVEEVVRSANLPLEIKLLQDRPYEPTPMGAQNSLLPGCTMETDLPPSRFRNRQGLIGISSPLPAGEAKPGADTFWVWERGPGGVSVDVPVTWGIRRPMLLLPANAADWPEARLRSVVLHELAHIRRGDWVVQAIAHLTCILFWFHPLACYLNWRVQEEAERACDDMVIVSGVARTEYAAHLLDVVQGLRRKQPLTAVVSMARHSHVTVRIQAILDTKRRRTPPSIKGLWAVTAVAVAILIPVVCLRPLSAQRAAPAVPGPGAASPIASDIQTVCVQSCLMPVVGPGVEVTLTDSKRHPASGAPGAAGLIRDHDVAMVIDTLKAAGAEALCIGDQRVVATTVVRASGYDLTANGIRLHSPFIIRAIGSPDALLTALNGPGGIVDNLKRTDPAMIHAVTSDALQVPALAVRPERKWMHTVTASGPAANPGAASLAVLSALAGFAEVTGPGVEVTLKDSTRSSSILGRNGDPIVRDRDIAAVIDQLRLAGAEAIAVGSQRMVATSTVQSADHELIINGGRVTAPFVIRAIGDPTALFQALNRPNDTVSQIRRADPEMVHMEKAEALRLPGFVGSAPRYAHTAVVPAFQQPHSGGPSGQTISLPGGISVELIAVGSAPDGRGEDWWKPDGTPMDDPPVRTNNRFHNSYMGVGTRFLSRSLFFRLHASSDVTVSTTGVVVDPARHLETEGLHYGRDMRLNDTHLLPEMPATGSVLLGFPPSETRCTYRFGIASGPWETIAVSRLAFPPLLLPALPAGTNRPSRVSIYLNERPQISYLDRQGKSITQYLLGGHPPLGDVARRIVAFDRDGREMPLEEGGLDYRGDQMPTMSASAAARIAEIRLQTRPYQWAEFADVALQSRRAPTPPPIATPSVLSGFRHTFACGITVAVLGVTEPKKDGGRWWLPNGKPLAGPVREFISRIDFGGWGTPAERPRAILLRTSFPAVPHLPDESRARTNGTDITYSEATEITPYGYGWKGVMHIPYEGGIPRSYFAAGGCPVAYPASVRECTYRIGIATGAWQNVGTLAMPAQVKHNGGSPEIFRGDVTCCLPDRPTLNYGSPDGQRHSVAFLPSGQTLGNAARRIVAVDRAGKLTPLKITGGGNPDLGNIIELTYADDSNLHQYNSIDLASIKEFRLQKRPYEWAEFKGIQLQPSR